MKIIRNLWEIRMIGKLKGLERSEYTGQTVRLVRLVRQVRP